MHITTTEALSRLNNSGELFLNLFAHGTLQVEVYKPHEKDRQQPHEKDELYVIISGTGDFFNGGDTCSFNPGDFLFVPAGVEHRFENFSEGFSNWVLFYGPEGGE